MPDSMVAQFRATMAILLVPTLGAAAPTAQEIAAKIHGTRAKIRSLSHRSTRTYEDGARAGAAFAIDEKGDKRFDLEATSGGVRSGETQSYYLRTGGLAYSYTDVRGRPVLQEVDRLRARAGRAEMGLLNACYSLYGERLEDVVRRGKIVPGEAGRVTVESTLGDGPKVRLSLRPEYGYLCDAWTVTSPGDAQRHAATGWKTFGGVWLPTTSDVETEYGGHQTKTHEAFRDIRINGSVAALLTPPPLAAGTRLRDEEKGILYEVGPGGGLVFKSRLSGPAAGVALDSLEKLVGMVVVLGGVSLGAYLLSRRLERRRVKEA